MCGIDVIDSRLIVNGGNETIRMILREIFKTKTTHDRAVVVFPVVDNAAQVLVQTVLYPMECDVTASSPAVH